MLYKVTTIDFLVIACPVEFTNLYLLCQMQNTRIQMCDGTDACASYTVSCALGRLFSLLFVLQPRFRWWGTVKFGWFSMVINTPSFCLTFSLSLLPMATHIQCKWFSILQTLQKTAPAWGLRQQIAPTVPQMTGSGSILQPNGFWIAVITRYKTLTYPDISIL